MVLEYVGFFHSTLAPVDEPIKFPKWINDDKEIIFSNTFDVIMASCKTDRPNISFSPKGRMSKEKVCYEILKNANATLTIKIEKLIRDIGNSNGTSSQEFEKASR